MRLCGISSFRPVASTWLRQGKGVHLWLGFRGITRSCVGLFSQLGPKGDHLSRGGASRCPFSSRRIWFFYLVCFRKHLRNIARSYMSGALSVKLLGEVVLCERETGLTIAFRSPNGRLLLTRFTRGLKLWSEVNDCASRLVLLLLWGRLTFGLVVQEGVCKQTIDRSKSVSSVVWLPNGQGKSALHDYPHCFLSCAYRAFASDAFCRRERSGEIGMFISLGSVFGGRC